ncbi:hypothetical protein QTP88_026287 [Uroleucon formosanum]
MINHRLLFTKKYYIIFLLTITLQTCKHWAKSKSKFIAKNVQSPGRTSLINHAPSKIKLLEDNIMYNKTVKFELYTLSNMALAHCSLHVFFLIFAIYVGIQSLHLLVPSGWMNRALSSFCQIHLFKVFTTQISSKILIIKNIECISVLGT